MLPLVPPETGFWSPYSGLDALCGNVLLIALDELVEEGLLDESDIPSPVPVAFARFDQVRYPHCCFGLIACKDPRSGEQGTQWRVSL